MTITAFPAARLDIRPEHAHLVEPLVIARGHVGGVENRLVAVQDVRVNRDAPAGVADDALAVFTGCGGVILVADVNRVHT